MSGVEGRVVVVTGAGGGLGRDYALLLAEQGAKVVVNDLGGSRDGTGGGSEMADRVVEEIRAAGGEAVASYDSVATRDGAERIVATGVEAYGTVHGVVNNAGILRDASFAKMTDEEWHLVQQVHLYGGFNVTKAAWPYFREQGFGRVVMAASTSGLFGNFGQSNYGAAKLGLVGLVNTLALEGVRSNILANAIAPMAKTRMTLDVAPEDLLDKLPPEFVSPVVGHLLSEELTTTGAVFVVGGGTLYRVAQFQNTGVTFEKPPSMEQVADVWEQVTDMSAAVLGSNPVG